MATARYVLKTLPGIDRPGHLHLAAHHRPVTPGCWIWAPMSTARAEHLFQFALMGSVLASAVDDNAETAGRRCSTSARRRSRATSTVKEAARRCCRKQSLNYVGFVEGDDVYDGTVDVVVCDGFVGNVSLKTSEGVAQHDRPFHRAEFSRNASPGWPGCGACRC